MHRRHLGLENAQRAADAARGLGKLLRPEQLDERAADDQPVPPGQSAHGLPPGVVGCARPAGRRIDKGCRITLSDQLPAAVGAAPPDGGVPMPDGGGPPPPGPPIPPPPPDMPPPVCSVVASTPKVSSTT